MKRFIFICVAFIALFAMNASGTNYQPTDQLQTFSIQQPVTEFSPVIIPAHEFAMVTQPLTAIMNENELIKTSNCVLPVYHNPDYGLCSLKISGISSPGNKFNRKTDYTFKNSIKIYWIRLIRGG